MDPALEHIMAMSMKPYQAFQVKPTKLIDAHLNFMRLNQTQNNPGAMASLQKNILEHISLMAQEQVQLEFVEELQEAQMIQQQMQAMGMQNPAMAAGMMQIHKQCRHNNVYNRLQTKLSQKSEVNCRNAGRFC